MSETVDNRVVSMQFDNKNFETNVKTSLSTLEKLKQSLNFNDTSKSLNSLSNASKSLDFSSALTSVSALEKRFSTMGIVGMTVIQNLTTSAMRLGTKLTSWFSGGIVSGGINRAMNLENANFQLQGLLKDADKVEAVMQNVSDAVDGTAYSLDAAAKVASQLAASGMEAGDSMFTSLRAIAGVAAMTNSEYSDIGSIFTTVAGQGKLMTYQLQQLSFRGMNAAATLAEYLGTTEAEVREMTTQGKISFETFAAAMDDAFGEHAKNANKTFNGAMSNIKAALGRIGALFVSPLIVQEGPLVKLFNTIREKINEIKNAIGPFATTVTDVIIAVVNALNNLLSGMDFSKPLAIFEGLETGFSHLMDVFNTVTEPIETVTETIETVTASVEDLGSIVDDVIIGKFGNGQERFDALTEAGQNYYRVQNKVNETLGCSKRYTDEQIAAQDELLGISQETTKTVTKTATATEDLTDTQKDQIKQLAKLSDEQLRSMGYTEEQISALQELRDAAEKLGMPFDEFIDKIDEINGRWILVESLKNIGIAISKVFSSISEAIKAVFEPLQAESLFNAIAGFHKLTEAMIPSEATCQKLTSTFKGLFAAVKLVSTVLGAGFKIAFSVGSALLQAMGLTVLDVTAKIGEMVYKFNEWFQDNIFVEFIEKIVEAIPKVIDGVKEFVDSLNIGEGASNAFAAVCHGITEVANLLGSDLQSAINKSLGSTLKTIKTVLSIFGTDLGSVIEKIANYITATVDWIDANSLLVNTIDKVSAIITKIVEGIASLISKFAALKPVQAFFEKLTKAVGDFFAKFDLSGLNFDGSLLDGIISVLDSLFGKINSWLETLNDSEHFGRDFVLGLVNGIKSGIVTAVNAVIELGKSIIEAICGVLGIHSPSTVMFEVGQNIIQGLFNGIKSAIGMVTELIAGIGQGISDGFSHLTEIDWKAVTTNFLNGIRSTAVNLGVIITGVGQAIVEFVKNVSWSDITSAIQNGVAAILGGVFSVIRSVFAGIGQSLYENFGGIWDNIVYFFSNLDWGVVATAITAGGMFFTANKLLDMIKSVAKVADGFVSPFKALSETITSIGKSINKYIDAKTLTVKADAVKSFAIAIGIIAASIWLLSTIDVGKAWNGVAIIAVMAGVITGLTIAMGKFGTVVDSKKQILNFAKVAGMLASLGLALILFAAAAKIISTMEWEDLGKAGAAIAGFGVVVAALVLIAGNAKSGAKIGMATVMIKKVAIALLAVAIVAKLIATMSWEDLGKAGAGIAGISAIIVGLIAATKLVGDGKNVAAIGTTILAVAAAIGVLVVAAKLIATMSWEEMGKAGVGIAALTGVIVGLMAATKLLNKDRGLSDVGPTILAVAAAIGILAVAARLIAGMSWGDMVKAAVGITGLGAILAGLVYITKYAGGTDLKGVAATLLAMSLSIGILAGICVLLGMVKTETLIRGIGAVAALAIMVSIMSLATRGATDTGKTMLYMAVCIGVMAAAIAVLSFIEPSKLYGAAAALTIVMYTFAIVEAYSSCVTDSFKTLIVLTAAIAVLAAALYLLASLPIESSMSAAISLSAMLLAFTGALKLMSMVGPVSKSAMKSAVALAGIVALLAIVLGALTALDCAPSIETAASLSLLLMALTVSVGLLSVMGVSASVALPGIGVMAAVVVALGALIVALGALNTYIPQLQTFLDSGITVLQKIGEAIGAFFGGIVAGFAGPVIDLLPKLGESLSQFAVGLTPFMNAMSAVPNDLAIKVGLLSAAIIALTAASFINGIASLLPLLPDMADMGAQLSAFATSLMPFIETMSMLDDTAVTACGKLAELVLSLTAAEILNGITSFISGGQDSAAFGEKLASLGSGVSAFMASMAGVDTAEVGTKADAVKTLCDAVSLIPTTGGLWNLIAGEKDAGMFGNQLATLGAGVAAFMVSMASVNTEGVAEKANAVKTLCEAASQIPTTGGLWGMIKGDNDAGEFGNQLAALGEGVAKFAEKTVGITADGIAPAKEAIQACIDISGMIPEDTGIFEKIANFFSGGGDDVTFIDKLVPVATSLKSFADEVTGIDFGAVYNSVQGVRVTKQIAEILSNNEIELTNDNTSFLNKLIPFGGYMKQYGLVVAGVDTASIAASVSGVTAIMRIGNIVSTTGISLNLRQIMFVGQLVPLAQGMKQYSVAVAGIDTGAITSSVTAAKSIVSLINTTSGVKTGGVSAFISAINDLSTISFDGIVKAFSGAPAALEAIGRTLTSALASGIQKGQGAAVTAAQSVVTTTSQAVIAKAVVFQLAGLKMVTAFAKGITMAAVSAKASVMAMASSAASGASASTASFRTAGYNCAIGFANGISSGSFRATINARAMANAAVTAAKNALQINSPSKVFMKVGMGVPEGFAKGIDKYGYFVDNSIDTMANDAIATTKSVVSRIGDALATTDLDSQPSIRPVVDMSDVESGVSAINSMFSDDFALGTKMNLNAIGTSMSRRNQNGVNDDVVSAINKLRKDVGNLENSSYSIGDITYSSDSEVANAIETLTRAVRVEGRV